MINLSVEYQHLVKTILLQHVPGVSVWLFGSRITNNVHDFSDIDLALVSECKIPTMQLSALKEAFDESNLPFRVDVVELSQVSDDFRMLIEDAHEALIVC